MKGAGKGNDPLTRFSWFITNSVDFPLQTAPEVKEASPPVTKRAFLDIRPLGSSVGGHMTGKIFANGWRGKLMAAAIALTGCGWLSWLAPGQALAETPSAADRAAHPLSPAELAALKAGDVFRECRDCPEMVVVPAGSFTMGSPNNEPGRYADEGPQHTVSIPKPFAVGRFAVTFAEWDACVADGGCGGYRPSDEGWGRASRPVINVSWDDAKAYVTWLGGKTGNSYRLLSEAEREYATRAGTSTPFWWGSSIELEQANYAGNFGYPSAPAKGESRQKTLTATTFQTFPVKSFQPNPWGLFQVHGNVWEWVEDCPHDNYSGAPTDGSAWTTGDCTSRVRRGGSFKFNPSPLRAARRSKGSTGLRNPDLGFRVAKTLAP